LFYAGKVEGEKKQQAKQGEALLVMKDPYL